jgi:hypothetical protein
MVADTPTGAALGVHTISAASIAVTLTSRNDNSRVQFRNVTSGAVAHSIRIRHSDDFGSVPSGLTTASDSVIRNNTGTAARRAEIGLSRTAGQQINTATGGFWVDFDVRIEGYGGSNENPQAAFTLDLVILTQGGGVNDHHYHPVTIRLAAGNLTTVLGDAGVSIDMGSTVFIDHVNWSSPQNVSNITFTERRAGELSNGNQPLARRMLHLEAPVGYEWTMGSTVGVQFRGAFVHSDTTASVVIVPVNRNGIIYSVAQITLPAGNVTRQTGLAGIGFGSFNITGLSMRPEAPNNIPIIIEGPKHGRIALLGGASHVTDWTPAGAWTRENVEMINQNISGVIITSTVGSEATLRSGTRLAPVGGANEARNWNSATLRIAERGRGTFLPRFSFETQILTPGVTVNAAQWRLVWADNFEEVAGWTSVEAHQISQNGRTVIFSIDNTTSRARAIAVEVRYRLHVEPNFAARHGNTDVDVQILGVSAPHQAYVTRDEIRTIARIWDPISLSGNAPSFNVGAGVMAVAVNQELGDVTITETREGALLQDSFIDVFLVATLGGFIETAALTWGQSWFFRTNTTGFLQGTNNLRLQPVGATPSSDLPANVSNGFRFRVIRPSSGGAGSVTFTDNFLTGSMMNHPEIQFVLSVAGPAVTQNAFVAADATPVNLLIPMPYTVIIGEAVQADQGFGDPGPVTGGGTPGGTTGGGTTGGNNLPAPLAFVGGRNEERNGAPLFTTHESVSGLLMQIGEFTGLVNNAQGFTIDNPATLNGRTAVIQVWTKAGGIGVLRVNIDTGEGTYQFDGGTPVSIPTQPPVIIGGRLFIPLSTISDTFGYAVMQDNGSFVIR